MCYVINGELLRFNYQYIVRKINFYLTSDETEISKLAKCQFGNKSYAEGEKFYPQNSCYSCLCTKNFKNVPVEMNPSCKKIDCGISIWSNNKVRKGCAPIYYGNNGCCPIDWRCPKYNDRILKKASDSTYKCEFGKLKSNVGAVINSNDKCVTCKCLLPPIISCIRTPNCRS